MVYNLGNLRQFNSADYRNYPYCSGIKIPVGTGVYKTMPPLIYIGEDAIITVETGLNRLFVFIYSIYRPFDVRDAWTFDDEECSYTPKQFMAAHEIKSEDVQEAIDFANGYIEYLDLPLEELYKVLQNDKNFTVTDFDD